MSTLLWGKVYLHEQFAGILRQEPGDRFSFTYDTDYLSSARSPVSYTLPLQEQPHISEIGLHPYFDNLVAEGWLENAQIRALGKKKWRRFELLLAFGADCIGAVSIIDPEPAKLSTNFDVNDAKEIAAFKGRASLSGIQPKLALIKQGEQYRPASIGELSTHIGKFASDTLPDILGVEWLTTQACKALLPQDDVVKMEIKTIAGISDEALVIERFDRSANGQRLHFEEFNQLLGLDSYQKYDGRYEDMADFIGNNDRCAPTDRFKLFRRIIAGLMTGNTDMHFKNFAMFHQDEKMVFTPCYDLVCASRYAKYQQIALSLAGVENLEIGKIKAKHILKLAQSFSLNNQSVQMILEEFEKKLSDAKDSISESDYGSQFTKDKIITQLEKRWNGTFSLITPHLLRKP